MLPYGSTQLSLDFIIRALASDGWSTSLATDYVQNLVRLLDEKKISTAEASALLKRVLDIDVITSQSIANDKSTIMCTQRDIQFEPNDLGIVYNPSGKEKK